MHRDILTAAVIAATVLAACNSTIDVSSTGGTGGFTVSDGAGGHGVAIPCTPDEHLSCYDGPMGTQDIGICKGGIKTCKADGSGYGPCEGQVLPKQDKCSTTEDEDCNGAATPCVSDVAWNLRLGNSLGINVAFDSVGNVVALLQSFNTDFGTGPISGLIAVKLDATGNILWAKSFGGNETWGGVAIDASDNILLTGTHVQPVDFGGGPITTTGGEEVFVAKLTSQGAHLWSKDFGAGTAVSRGLTIAVDAQSNVLFGGHFSGSINFGGNVFKSPDLQGDLFIAKLSPSGSHVWSKQGHAVASAEVQKISVDANDNLLLTGFFGDALDLGAGPLMSKGGDDIFVAKLLSDGSLVFANRYGDSNLQMSCKGVFDLSGNIILVGSFQGSFDFGGAPLTAPQNLYSTFLTKLDDAGHHVWSKSFGNGDYLVANDISVDELGNVLYVGSFKGSQSLGAGTLTSAGQDDVLLTKYTPSGSAIWTKKYGDGQDQFGNGLAVSPTGAVAFCGSFGGSIDFGMGALSAAAGQADAFVTVLNP